MMTGALIAGNSVQKAARLQMIIMFSKSVNRCNPALQTGTEELTVAIP